MLGSPVDLARSARGLLPGGRHRRPPVPVAVLLPQHPAARRRRPVRAVHQRAHRVDGQPAGQPEGEVPGRAEHAPGGRYGNPPDPRDWLARPRPRRAAGGRTTPPGSPSAAAARRTGRDSWATRDSSRWTPRPACTSSTGSRPPRCEPSSGPAPARDTQEASTDADQLPPETAADDPQHGGRRPAAARRRPAGDPARAAAAAAGQRHRRQPGAAAAVRRRARSRARGHPVRRARGRRLAAARAALTASPACAGSWSRPAHRRSATSRPTCSASPGAAASPSTSPRFQRQPLPAAGAGQHRDRRADGAGPAGRAGPDGHPAPLPGPRVPAAESPPDLYGGSARRRPERGSAALMHARTGSARPQGYLYQLAAGAGWTSLPFLPLIRQPTLILSGDDDPLIPLANARLMRSLIPPLAAARLPRRPPGPGHRGRRARPGGRPVPDRRARPARGGGDGQIEASGLAVRISEEAP